MVMVKQLENQEENTKKIHPFSLGWMKLEGGLILHFFCLLDLYVAVREIKNE